MAGIKNLDTATVLHLKDQIAYQPGQVVSRTLAQNDALSMTLFSFDRGEEIRTHESGGDAFVTCLDGVGRIAIDGVQYELHACAASARGVWAGAVQDAARCCVLKNPLPQRRPRGRVFVAAGSPPVCAEAQTVPSCREGLWCGGLLAGGLVDEPHGNVAVAPAAVERERDGIAGGKLVFDAVELVD